MTRLVTEGKIGGQGGEGEKGRKGKEEKIRKVHFMHRGVGWALPTLSLTTPHFSAITFHFSWTAATRVLNTRHDLSNWSARSSWGSFPSSPSLICESGVDPSLPLPGPSGLFSPSLVLISFAFGAGLFAFLLLKWPGRFSSRISRCSRAATWAGVKFSRVISGAMPVT